ncbi:GIY-YIG nuclease family protein [Sphingosinicellaceae bacterium]|nr:GIY-YIG nuclease family protein [Sphingosinicellaceae bacterium]
MNDGGHVYILANRKQGALYTGVTSDLALRIGQHRSDHFKGFTSEYNIKRLMWSQHFETIEPAIRREKQIKEWRRAWKIELIEADNPDWDDLAVKLFNFPPL